MSRNNPVTKTDKRKTRICIIGAGFSGICAAVQLKKHLDSIDLVIFDENEDFGGVWLVNNYPGSECDVPSHLYSYSFEPNPNWSHSYAPQSEILDYLKATALKHDLYSCAKFQHSVKEMNWDERTCTWNISVQKISETVSKTLNFDIIFTAPGRFHEPNIPEKFLPFKGPIIHSAEWDSSIELRDKVVAVVGCGSSAAQIIPAIAPQVRQLLVFQRRAPWVIPKKQFRFSESVQKTFNKFPCLNTFYRNYLYCTYELNHFGFIFGTFLSKLVPWLAKFHKWKQVKDPKLRERLHPNYDFGCKRVIPSSDYYPTFKNPHVELITSPIMKATSESILTERGEEYCVDVLVLATGFKVRDHYSSAKIIGLNGLNVYNSWIENGPSAYLGVITSNAPNLFFLLGPNTATGYTTVILQVEAQVQWIVNAIRKKQDVSASQIRVKNSAEDRYMKDIHEKLKQTIYGSTRCGAADSWYLNGKGNVVEIYPNTTSSYAKLCAQVNCNDLDFI